MIHQKRELRRAAKTLDGISFADNLNFHNPFIILDIRHTYCSAGTCTVPNAWPSNKHSNLNDFVNNGVKLPAPFSLRPKTP
jgi:hypothetical protein